MSETPPGSLPANLFAPPPCPDLNRGEPVSSFAESLRPHLEASLPALLQLIEQPDRVSSVLAILNPSYASPLAALARDRLRQNPAIAAPANQARIYAIDAAARSRMSSQLFLTASLGAAVCSAVIAACWNSWQWPGTCAFAPVLVALAAVLESPSWWPWSARREGR